MDESTVNASIVERISKGVSTNEIITGLCEQENINWEEAKELVERIRQANQSTISRRQFPLLIVMALFFFLTGFGLMIFSIVSLVQIHELYSATQQPTWNLVQTIMLLFNYGSGFIAAIVLGFGMVLGSLIGMRRAWSDILGIV